MGSVKEAAAVVSRRQASIGGWWVCSRNAKKVFHDKIELIEYWCDEALSRKKYHGLRIDSKIPIICEQVSTLRRCGCNGICCQEKNLCLVD